MPAAHSLGEFFGDLGNPQTQIRGISSADYHQARQAFGPGENSYPAGTIGLDFYFNELADEPASLILHQNLFNKRGGIFIYSDNILTDLREREVHIPLRYVDWAKKYSGYIPDKWGDIEALDTLAEDVATIGRHITTNPQEIRLHKILVDALIEHPSSDVALKVGAFHTLDIPQLTVLAVYYSLNPYFYNVVLPHQVHRTENFTKGTPKLLKLLKHLEDMNPLKGPNF